MSNPEEIEQLQQQLAAHRRTLAVYLRQFANLGADHAPPGVYNGIAEARTAIERLKSDLRARNVAVADQANDLDVHPGSVGPIRAIWRPEDRAAMLAKVRRIWINGVLKESLWNDALIALRLAERPNAVARPYGLRLRAGCRRCAATGGHNDPGCV